MGRPRPCAPSARRSLSESLAWRGRLIQGASPWTPLYCPRLVGSSAMVSPVSGTWQRLPAPGSKQPSPATWGGAGRPAKAHGESLHPRGEGGGHLGRSPGGRSDWRTLHVWFFAGGSRSFSFSPRPTIAEANTGECSNVMRWPHPAKGQLSQPRASCPGRWWPRPSSLEATAPPPSLSACRDRPEAPRGPSSGR